MCSMYRRGARGPRQFQARQGQGLEIGLLLQGTEPIGGQKPQGGQGQTKGFVVSVAQPPQTLPHQHRGAPSVVPFEV